MLNSLKQDGKKYKEVKEEIRRIIPNGQIYDIVFEEKIETDVGDNRIVIPILQDSEKYKDYPNKKGMYKIARMVIEGKLNEHL